MDLQRRKTELEQLLQQKVNQFSQLQQAQQNLSQEILILRGKLQLVEELIKEESKEKKKNDR